MALNASAAWEESPVLNSSSSSSSPCGHDMTGWERRMDEMYTYFYLLLFIPGLLLNATALWVLCRHISKKTKAVIFMINLALADLAHILSLPLRIHYYFTHTWPFGRGACLFCFYLKYLNMYAAIVFLVCISVQRCVFLLNPFSARQWRRRYDLAISAAVWVVVGLACSPFILMRSSSTTTSSPPDATPTQHPFGDGELRAAPPGCFKDLPMRRLPVSLAVATTVLAELFGFLVPLTCISYSYVRIARSLRQTAPSDPTARGRLPSVAGEKRRALRLVLGCSALFLLCFAPYHVNFLLYLMVSQDIVSHCATELAVRRFHPVSLCLASLSCCLNPLLYYFLTAEFRLHLARRSSSFSASLLSSPTASAARRPAQRRLTSAESSCSEREESDEQEQGSREGHERVSSSGSREGL